MATNLALTASITAHSENGINVKGRGADGDTALQWISTSANAWWTADLGEDKTFDKISIMTGPVSYSFVVKGSNNGVDWDTLITASNAIRNSLVDFPLSPAATYRHVGIIYTDGANWSTLHEMQIWEAAVPITLSVPAASLTLAPQQNIQLFPIFLPAVALSLIPHAPASYGLLIPIGNAPGLVLNPLAPALAMAMLPPCAALIMTAQGPAYVWALPASAQPAAQVIYTCTLTGDGETPALPDLILPMSSFQGTMRDGEASYLSCIIPNAVDYETEITARANGDIVVKKGYRLLDGTVQMEEIARADFETLALDEGARSASATLVGHRTVSSSSVKEITVQGVSYYALQANTKRRIRATLDLFLRIGDTCIYGAGAGDRLIVGQIWYAVDPRQAIMEVTEA